MVSENKRVLSIDTLRGLDFIWIMGIDSLLIALATAWPNTVTKFIGNQMLHVSVGLHFEDLIFPTFMFLSGCSWPLELRRSRILARAGTELPSGHRRSDRRKSGLPMPWWSRGPT